jgi:hypothetical protein
MRSANNQKSVLENVFCIPIQCQACKTNIVVLVHRDGTKIQLVGRSERAFATIEGRLPQELKAQRHCRLCGGQSLP